MGSCVGALGEPMGRGRTFRGWEMAEAEKGSTMTMLESTWVRSVLVVGGWKCRRLLRRGER